MNRNGRSPIKSNEIMEQVVRIAHDHILYAERCPERLEEIAARLKITSRSALALAIADHICEEFTLTLNDSPKD